MVMEPFDLDPHWDNVTSLMATAHKQLQALGVTQATYCSLPTRMEWKDDKGNVREYEPLMHVTSPPECFPWKHVDDAGIDIDLGEGHVDFKVRPLKELLLGVEVSFAKVLELDIPASLMAKIAKKLQEKVDERKKNTVYASDSPKKRAWRLRSPDILEWQEWVEKYWTKAKGA